MSSPLGMDTGKARASLASMRAQVDALSWITGDLLSTGNAAIAPQQYGVLPGELTVSPQSAAVLSAARHLLAGAQSAAEGLLGRLATEADAQDAASGNIGGGAVAATAIGGTGLAAVVGTVGDIRWWRNWLTYPRTALEAPAALRMLAANPSLLLSQLNPARWGLQATHAAGAELRLFTRTLDAPKWVRNFYQGASNLKLQNYVDPNFLHSTGLHSSPTGVWTDVFHSPVMASGVKNALVGVGKGFSVLGAGVGIYNTVQGIAGMTDGDITSDDAWQLADGIVGTVTSIGSLAPPPVGVAFAAVGLAYTAGRWLFGEDDSGRTGIDKIGDFGNAVGGGLADGAKAVGDGLGNAAEAAGDLVDDLWPW